MACGIASAGDAPGPLETAAIYERARVEFTDAVLFIPGRTNMDTSLFKFAPLILMESPPPQSSQSSNAIFGALEPGDDRVRVNSSQPTVYAWQEAVTLRGRPLARFSYVWWFSAESAQADAPGLPVQGIRITATTNGQPLVFETLLDPTGARVAIVSQSLEAAAAREFGAPLTGRRFAIERSVAEMPHVVVARVIEEGPLELGPVVYLSGTTHAIVTVICRCMPAQVMSIHETRYYDLHGASQRVEPGLATRALKQTGARLCWGGTTPEEGLLLDWLRLPTRLP